MKICSKSLKEGYLEEFMTQLRKIVYGDHSITMNFMYICNEPDIVKVIKVGQLKWL
jgi:hypothetical protein